MQSILTMESHDFYPLGDSFSDCDISGGVCEFKLSEKASDAIRHALQHLFLGT